MLQYGWNLRIFLLFGCPIMSNSLWPMACSTPGLPISHNLPEFAQVHAHCISDTIHPSHPLTSLLFLLSIFPSIRDFSNKSAVCIRWSNTGASASASVFPVEYSRLISFKIDLFDFLAVQRILKNLLQHHSLKASIPWCSSFLMVQFSQPYVTTWKTIALTIWTFVGRVISLLFNTPSRFVTAFLTRSNHLLILWL